LKLRAEYLIESIMANKDGQVAGIFTECNYARKGSPINGKPEEIRIEEVMRKEFITVDPNLTVNK